MVVLFIPEVFLIEFKQCGSLASGIDLEWGGEKGLHEIKTTSLHP